MRSNKASQKGSIFKILAPLLGLVILCVFLIWPVSCLAAECGGRTLFAVQICPGDFFEVSYRHSVNQSEVADFIEWDGEELILRKSISSACGAGIHVPSDGGGGELSHVDGHYELVGIDRHMRTFSIMTQDVPDQRIVAGGKEYSLLELAGSGKSVVIAVKRLPKIRLMIEP